MSVMHRVLAAVGLQVVEPSREREVLNRLAFCTANDDEYLSRLHQAELIAQAGGVTDEKLEALLHLAAMGMMTPTSEAALHRVGIDTRPWLEVEAEWKAGRP